MVQFDAILADAIAAYDHLLAEGFEPGGIVLAGDSAGGHLALALCATLAETRPRDLPGSNHKHNHNHTCNISNINSSNMSNINTLS